jgi:hypothetical protein
LVSAFFTAPTQATPHLIPSTLRTYSEESPEFAAVVADTLEEPLLSVEDFDPGGSDWPQPARATLSAISAGADRKNTRITNASLFGKE